MKPPACMTPDEWAAWSEMNERMFGPLRSDSPCRDCTPLFHADMLAGGMCDGVPRPETDRGGRVAVPEPEHLRGLSLAELRALRATLPYHGPPEELVLACSRARWREYRRGLRVSA
jgi:hypothetical protein